ncbi:MAG: outer membrane protein assembly factor BamD [Bdellovibrionales bacterium]|nr:outer membrane protein assembly factor BamD [Bdellovibrionales bacterium]
MIKLLLNSVRFPLKPSCFTNRFLSLFFVGMFFVLNYVGCASEQSFDTSTPGGSFAKAKYLEDEERFEEAIMEYQSLKNRFPYNKLAVQSELRVADIQFNREAYIESQHAYQLFKELHPKHEKSDYVTFQLAMSYFNQLPGSIDRDLTIAQDAIIYFDEVILTYPNSPFAAKSKEYKAKAYKMLAEKELYIARFYLIREMYDSALLRYENMLKNDKAKDLAPKALYGATVSAVKSKEKIKAKNYFNILTTQYASSDEAKKIQTEYGNELR